MLTTVRGSGARGCEISEVDCNDHQGEQLQQCSMCVFMKLGIAGITEGQEEK
jgi:uncharacterized protein YjhX (UPF0386 family)